ncbi:MAG: hypothetical protein KC486_28665, partial [Myxococcales bacterium]|nr:hypothetical protein [Myxococcales bacterium]
MKLYVPPASVVLLVALNAPFAPVLGYEVGPDEYEFAGHATLVPSQTSCASQIPALARQTTEVPWRASA